MLQWSYPIFVYGHTTIFVSVSSKPEQNAKESFTTATGKPQTARIPAETANDLTTEKVQNRPDTRYFFVSRDLGNHVRYDMKDITYDEKVKGRSLKVVKIILKNEVI